MKDNTDKTLILVGLVCLLLLLMHFLPPLSICGVRMRHVSVLSDLSPHHADTIARDATAIQNEKMPQAKNSSEEQKWPTGVERIYDYSDGGIGGMAHYYAMADSLQRKKLTNRPLRIAYFSDSYTEGDILTADLREKLQTLYGGEGVGWVDAANDVNLFRLSLSVADKGMTGHMAMKKESYNATMAGLAARYAPFRGKASLTYEGRHQYAHAATWSVVRFYLRSGGYVNVAAHLGEGCLTQTARNVGVQEVMFDARGQQASTMLTIAGTGIAFGVSLEGKTGIVLDNFSMRSSSGLPLGEIPMQTLKEFQGLRHYDLVILAFGGNVVSPTGKADECEWYIRKMKKVVEKFKLCFSDASLLLFGAPDFGFRQDGQVVTPESIKGLIARQRQMAAESKIGFYDLQRAMGGDGVAGRLFDQKMVGSDLFHINQCGGAYVAARVFRSLEVGQKIYSKHYQEKAAGASD